MCCIQTTTATSGLNLLHVAAVVRSFSCAELLVRHGVDATAVSKATSEERSNGLSPLDLLLYDLRCLHFDELQLPSDIEAAELEPVAFDKFALMLLSCGATVKPKCVFRKLTEQFAIVQQKHSQRQQQQINSRARVAAVHVAASWCKLGDNSSSSSSIADFVQIQLVHAVTQQRGAKLYTNDAWLLSQLFASAVAAAATAEAATATGDSASSRETTTAATATTATAGTSSAECNNSSATTVSGTGGSSSGSKMLAVQ
jgi:hypothetical protein